MDIDKLDDAERGFVARGTDEGSLYFDYFFETTDDPLRTALHFCREQSTALWHRPGVDEDYRPRHAAKLLELRVVEESDTPWLADLNPYGAETSSAATKAETSSAATKAETSSAPTAPTGAGARYFRCRVRLAHPWINFGPRLPNLLTAAAGEGAFFTPAVTLVRLMDMQFPPDFLQAFQGPRFGVEGIRDLLGVYTRPIICGVVKPNLGMEPQAFADIAYQGLLGGADIVKDDEMLADTTYSPTATRARLVFDLLRQAVQETGEKRLYLVNITDEVDRLCDLHDMVFDLGGQHAAVMLNALPVGLSACRMLCAHSRVPVFSHFDMIAALSRVPFFGISSLLMTRLQRLAGFDAIIMPGLSSRMATSNREVLENVRACLEPMGHLKPSLPLPGGSDWAGSLPHMLETLQTRDFGIIPGRGIFGHPAGPAAGARSIRDAWDAIERGLHPRDYATPALQQAYQAFDTNHPPP